jgi:hypothetical protein
VGGNLKIVNLKKIGGFGGLRDIWGVYCGRPSPLANWFEIDKHGTREEVVALYEQYLLDHLERKDLAITKAFESLNENSILGCWCEPLLCHCEVIEEIWNYRFKE